MIIKKPKWECEVYESPYLEFSISRFYSALCEFRETHLLTTTTTRPHDESVSEWDQFLSRIETHSLKLPPINIVVYYIKWLIYNTRKMSSTGIAVGINKGFPVEKRAKIARPSNNKGVSIHHLTHPPFSIIKHHQQSSTNSLNIITNSWESFTSTLSIFLLGMVWSCYCKIGPIESIIWTVVHRILHIVTYYPFGGIIYGVFIY